MTGQGNQPPAPHHRPHHVADPAALEDPVHHDVAEHELHEEAESDAEDEEAEHAEGKAGPSRSVPHDRPDAAAFDLPVDPTGDARVDAALGRLAGLGGLPATDHPGLYEDVHRRLQATLDEIDPRGT